MPDELALLVDVGGGLLEGGLDGAAREALADELLGLLVRGELLQVGQLAQALEAEALEECLGGGVADGLGALRVSARLSHEALVDEARDDAVGVDAADGLHALACHGLVVGDDGQGLERGLGEPAGVPAHDERLDLVVERRVGEQAPAAGDLAQLEAAVGVGVLGGEVGERLGRLAGGDAQDGGEVGGAYGVARDEEHRLEGALHGRLVELVELLH